MVILYRILNRQKDKEFQWGN